MFSFNKSRRFAEVQKRMRRLCDLTVPDRLPLSAELPRLQNRYNRTVPALICPIENKLLRIEDSLFVVTCNMNDRSVGLLMPDRYEFKKVVLGIWAGTKISETPWFFFGEVRRTAAIGGGFWILGIELREFANDRGPIYEALYPLAQRLLPPAVSEAAATAGAGCGSN